ncbi:hypothetical protein ACVW1A_005285 [Bradyrhizobium sp. LB1.3]
MQGSNASVGALVPVIHRLARSPVAKQDVTVALTDTELLTACMDFTLHYTHEAEQQTFKELETSGSTRLVNALRVFRLQRAILAVGMFSMFEALLQSKLSWARPFVQLDDYLRAQGQNSLAAAIVDYGLAVNVLKHGEGRSHQDLIARADKVEFKVRAKGEHFHGEGDVSDVGILVDVDDKFVWRCAELIEKASEAIRALLDAAD